MPVDTAAAKALTIGSRGFDYKLAKELLLGTKFSKPPTQMWLSTDDTEGVYLIAQAVARGQGKTEGYHERRIPVSRKVRQAFLTKNTDELAKLADERIAAIAEVRKMLWAALAVLFGNGAKDESGKDKDASDAVKERANLFAQPFEAQCDVRFFTELIDEIEADDREAVREKWLLALAERAKRVLQSAFDAGPRSGQLRYRAQSAALGRLNTAMRGSKLPALAQALKSMKSTQSTSTDEETHEHT
jgi:CRISPR system Cascade subunit CasA